MQGQGQNGSMQRGTGLGGYQDTAVQGLGWFSIGLGLAEVAAPGAVAELIGVDANSRVRSILRVYGLREITAGLGILSGQRQSTWLWSRVAGDLVDLASLLRAMGEEDSDRNRLAGATAAVAGVTALDIYCATRLTRNPQEADTGTIPVARSATVNKSPEDVYGFWRRLENMPRFMQHIEHVRELDERRSHWVAKGPAGMRFEWDSEITADEPGRRIAWRTLEGAGLPHTGEVRFERATGGRGTYVHVQMEYTPPGGKLAAGVAKLFGKEPGQQIAYELHLLKQILETGEVVASDASIHTGMHPAQPAELVEA